MILSACVSALHQYGRFDWVQRHDNIAPALCEHCAFTSAVLQNHSAFTSAVLQNAIRHEQSSTEFVAAVTRRQAKAQTQASPDTSAPEKNDSEYSLSHHNMLECIKAGYAHDDQCGSPDSEKLWPHMYAENGLWIHHSGSIVVQSWRHRISKAMLEHLMSTVSHRSHCLNTAHSSCATCALVRWQACSKTLSGFSGGLPG